MTTEHSQAPAVKQSAKSDKDDPRIVINVDGAQNTTPTDKAESKPVAEAGSSGVDGASRLARAEAIIRTNVHWAIGSGVVLIPVVDLLAVSGIQIKMLSELSKLYGLSFREDIAKKIMGSLFSSVLGVGIGVVLCASIAKIVPVVGTSIGLITVPIAAGAFTHTTGKIFVMHFESGGTLFDLDPTAMRAHFKQEFERSKEFVAQMHKDEQAKGAKAS